MIVADRLDPSGCWARSDSAPPWAEPRSWENVEAAYVYACGLPAHGDPLGLCPHHRRVIFGERAEAAS